MFASRPGTREAVPALALNVVNYHELPSGIGEAEALSDLMVEKCSLLIVDHYDLDVEFERACRPWAERILVIDDLANRKHDCDLLVDQTPGRDEHDYSQLVPGDCIVLAGSGYALLDRRFRQARAIRANGCDAVQRILVNFGGSDIVGATVLALEALSEASLGLMTDVVVGTPGNDFDRIRSLAASLEPPATVHVAVSDMASLMARADLAIGAGGVSSLERCCVGLPSAIVTVAENQNAMATALGRAGAAAVLGTASAVLPGALAHAIRGLVTNHPLRIAMCSGAARITDGFGAARVAAACLSSSRSADGGRVWLRRATPDDEALMLAWQSAPGARIHSRNPSAPEPHEHRAWFRRMLCDPNCVFNIVVCEGCPVGVLRLDERCEGAYEISILVASEYQNRKIGGNALALARSVVPQALIRAEIHPDNEASIRMFERAGYRQVGGHWASSPELSCQ